MVNIAPTQSITRYLFYTLLLITPWIWVRHNSELFEFPKMVFVYFITTLIVTSWVATMVLTKSWLIKKTPLDLPLVAFLFSQIISTVLSIDRYTSFLGYYSRSHGGLASTISYLLLFYAFVSNFDTKQTKRAIAIVMVSATLASLYAIPEHFGYAFSCLIVSGDIATNCWIQDVQTRIFGTFGQPNWLAAYIVTVIPLVWAGLLNLKPTQHQVKFYLFLSIQTLLFGTLLFTKSRSGLLAVAVGYLIFWIVMLIKRRRSVFKAFISVTLSLLIITTLFGSEYSPSLLGMVSRIQNPPTSEQANIGGTVLDRGDLSIPIINKGGTESGKIREIVWKGAIEVFKRYPVFGSGVETFAYVYYNFRLAEHNLVSEWDFIYNKAHNEFLNFAATTGAVGLGAYLSFMVTFVILCGLTLKSTKNIVTQSLSVSLLAGFIALSVSNFFGFSTVSVGLLFFLFPAFLVGLKQPKLPLFSATKLTLTQKTGLATLVLASLAMLGTIATYYVADIFYAKASQADSDQEYSKALQHFQTALALAPHEARFHNDYADTLSKAALVAALDEDNATMTDYASQAFHASSMTLQLNPVQINHYKSQAGVFIRLSVLDPTLLEVAETMLSEALTLAPTDAKLVYNLGLIKLDQQQFSAAQAYFEQAVTLKANYEEARMELATLYTQEQPQKAIEQYQYILNFIAPGNTKARQGLEQLLPAN